MVNADEWRGIEAELPKLLVENDTLGRAYRSYKGSADKDAFLNSIVAALAELNPNLSTTVGRQAQVEMWAVENGVLDQADVLKLRSDLDRKRAEIQAVSEVQARTAQYLGMGQR